MYTPSVASTEILTQDVLQGPMELLENDRFIPSHVIASTGHVLQFLKHWRTPQKDGDRLLRIGLSWYQYQVGVLYPMLQNRSTNLSYAQGGFIPAGRRKYLHTIDATIKVDKPCIYPQLREADIITIMEIASTMELTSIQMKRLNQVRIHLVVMWVSEISTIGGTQI